MIKKRGRGERARGREDGCCKRLPRVRHLVGYDRLIIIIIIINEND